MQILDLEEIRRSLPLKVATSKAWAPLAVANLNVFLADHASCERKAHAAAMMMVNRYPDYPELQDRMIALAREELLHFQQVVGLMRPLGISLCPDETDPYVKALLSKVRHPREQNLMDRLLVVALIEARSCERFCLFANALPEGELRRFYENFAREEAQHFPLFVSTAKLYYPESLVDETLDQMLSIEAEVLARLPVRATVH